MDQTKEVETDVLVIGGAIAGCSAAIKASQLGVKVTLAEKAAIGRCGCAPWGLDHIWWYFPGGDMSLDDVIDAHMERLCRKLGNRGVLTKMWKESFNRARDLENLGIEFKFNGKYHWRTHHHLGVYNSLIYAGHNLTSALAKEVTRCNVNVLNRTMITRLIVDRDAVIGAIGLNTRNGEFIVIKSKATILATGGATRLYPSPTNRLFSTFAPPNDTGDGYSMAFRAGAQLINMEFPMAHPTTKGFRPSSTGGFKNAGASVIDAYGNPLEAGIDRSETSRLHKKAFEAGRYPFYVDPTGISKEKYDEVCVTSIKNEVPMYFDFLQFKGFDYRRDIVEIEDHEWDLRDGRSGLLIEDDGRTSLEGLFAAGDCTGGVFDAESMGAIVIAWNAGESAAQFAGKNVIFDIESNILEEEKKRIFNPLKLKEGVNWADINMGLQKIMKEYAGEIRHSAGLERCIENIFDLREEYIPRLVAKDFHELMRCLEVQSLCDTAEMIARAALARKESRFFHLRTDYPRTDDENWLKFVVLERKPNGDIRIFLKAPD